MPKRLQKELEGIKKRILALGAMVEERVRMGIKAIENWDAELALEIRRRDHEIDELEIEVEEECLKILALHQPVAVDLRFIIAVIKINNDLERIGDLAVNIGNRVRNIARRQRLHLPFDFSVMAEKAASMLHMSLDALVGLDMDRAHKVLVLDDEVDHLNRENYDAIKSIMMEKPESAGCLLNMYILSRHLERLADHATNIAEEVIYLVEGEIVRHSKPDEGVKTAQ